MSLSTSNVPSLSLLLSNAVFSQRDVFPHLHHYTVFHVFETDWHLLSKFDDPAIANWIDRLIRTEERIHAGDAAQRAVFAKRVNAFFGGDSISSGIKPIHTIILNNNASMFQLILRYIKEDAKKGKYTASFLLNTRTGLLRENETGIKTQEQTFNYSLMDFAILSNSAAILNLLVQNQIDV